jgi:excisionase family DNA binding protein
VRLLTDREAAKYLGASRSYVRALVARGAIRRVDLPATNGHGGRARLLRVDLRDLDAFVDSMKA